MSIVFENPEEFSQYEKDCLNRTYKRMNCICYRFTKNPETQVIMCRAYNGIIVAAVFALEFIDNEHVFMFTDNGIGIYKIPLEGQERGLIYHNIYGPAKFIFFSRRIMYYIDGENISEPKWKVISAHKQKREK